MDSTGSSDSSHIPSSSQPWVGNGMEAQRGALTCLRSHSQWGQSVGLSDLDLLSIHPCDEAGSQLAARAWGTRRGGEDPPCLLRGQRPALWNTAVGQTQSFQPTWSGAGGTAAGLFPCTEHSLCPRLRFAGFTCLASLIATETQGGGSCYPHFFI